MVDPTTIKAVLSGGTTGAAVPLAVMFMLFTPQSDYQHLTQQYERHVAEERTTTVQNLVAELQKEPSGPYRDTLCKTLEQTLTQICLDSPSHPFCEDRNTIMAKAGC